MATTVIEQSVNPPPKRPKREWSPRFWTGMAFGGWLRLLIRNRFAVHWRYWPHAVLITGFSLFHSAWWAWQWLLVGRRASKTALVHDPLFIIGHWRAGTTLLHELLVLDERHTFPTTFQCLVPNHFLLTESFARRWLRFLLPSRRPMDNMAAGWERPQEDEFALCNLGVPSPYLTIAFPNHPPQNTEYLTLQGLPAAKLRTWKLALLRFLRHIAYRDPRRIVLKSPPHTCRIRTLIEMFPDARFVHIVRDPFVVIPSTVNLWKTLRRRHALQQPHNHGLEEYVFETFEQMYRQYETDRGLLDPSHLCEVRYEDLVRDPRGELRAVYEKLGLGQFERMMPKLDAFLAANEGYQTNRYPLTPHLRHEIRRRCGSFMRKYGYGDEGPGEGGDEA